MNTTLVLGASLHWSSLLYTGNSSSLELTPLLHFVVFLCALLMTFASRVLERRASRLAVALTSMVSGALLLVMLSVPDSGQHFIGTNTWVLDIIVALNIAPPIILWGFAFASLDKRSAAFHAMLTGLLAIILTCVVHVAISSDPVAISIVQTIERLVSCLLVLSDGTGFSSTRRAFEQNALPTVTRFAFGRVALGVVIGIYYFSSSRVHLMPVPCVLAAGISLVGAALLLPRKTFAYEGLPVFPLILMGLACLPLAFSGYAQILSQIFSILWLCWIFTSSVQLSGLKETFGLSEARLSSGEKAAIMLGWALGLTIAQALPDAFLVEPIPLVAVYLVMVWGVWSCYRCAHNRIEDELIAQSEAERRQRRRQTFDALCERHSLTERERAVAELLSSGLDRRSICQQLCISDGTVRAHATHIYQKLGIHSREELVKLVDGDA